MRSRRYRPVCRASERSRDATKAGAALRNDSSSADKRSQPQLALFHGRGDHRFYLESRWNSCAEYSVLLAVPRCRRYHHILIWGVVAAWGTFPGKIAGCSWSLLGGGKAMVYLK